jgi:ankyrin repeat protein
MVAAILAHDPSRVRAVLAKGADADDEGALNLACRTLDLEIATLLLEHGADPNLQRQGYKATALQNVCSDSGRADERLALTTLLLGRGALPNGFPPGRDGALHCAAMYRLPEVVAVLLAAGADVNLPGAYGRRPIHYAAASGDLQSVLHVLAASPDLEARDQGKQNALFNLVNAPAPSVAAAEALLDAGLDLLALGSYEQTALAAAARRGNAELVELFVRRGAPVDQPGSFGRPPIIAALRERHLAIVDLLLERGADPQTKNLLSEATRLGANDLVRRLLAVADVVDPEAFFEAARRGEVALVGELLDSGVDIEAESWGNRALHKAAAKGRLEVVRLLLERGAELDARDSRGNTPMLHAAYNGQLEVVKLLVESGADVQAQNTLHWTGVMQAVVERKLPTVRYLVEQGTRLDPVDQENGYTALTLARVSAPSIVELLEAHGAEERPLRRPPEGELFAMSECDICAFLQAKKEMGRTRGPQLIPTLERVSVRSEVVGPYTTQTTLLLRCPICGTHYEQQHTIDQQDEFIGGPNISQHYERR